MVEVEEASALLRPAPAEAKQSAASQTRLIPRLPLTLIPLMLQLSLHRDELLAEALREVLIARLGQARSRQLLVKRCMRRHDEEYVLKL